jgi:putative ABC transport system permease protein
VIRVALKGLLGRKFRVALVFLAIVLGVAMVSGTFVLTDTISRAFDDIFTASQSGTSVVISGKKVVERRVGASATVPASLLTKVRRLPGVSSAAGQIKDTAKIIGRDGDVITARGPPSFGYGIDFSRPPLNPLELEAGRWPRRPGEVAIDEHTAKDQRFRIGETVSIQASGPVRRYRLTGTLTIGGASTGGSTIAAFELSTAQQLFAKEDQFDSISVAAKSGLSPEQLSRAIRPLLPSSVEVKTADEQAKSDSEQIKEGLSFLTYFLLAFAAIALFVGSFVIFNTLSITVAQRTREFATLRTLGALRRQILQSIVVEMLVIGIVSSTVGLALGLALAEGLSALISRAGVALPTSGLVFAPRTVGVSLAVGVAVAVVAGLFPALRATRVPPIAAVREGSVLPPSRFAHYTTPVATVVIGVAVALIAVGIFVGSLATTNRLILLAGGCLLLFTGAAVLSRALIPTLAAVLGYPAERIGGVSGRLARENAVRNPGRTAATAAALMIGLALVTFVAVLAEGLRASIVDRLHRDLLADYVVSSRTMGAAFTAEAGSAVESAHGVVAASSDRGEQAKVAGGQVRVTGVDPATIRDVYRFDWTAGSDTVLGRLGRNGALVTDAFADDKDLKVGSRIRMVTPDDKKLTFKVNGIYEAPLLGSVFGSVSISRAAFDATFTRPMNQNIFIRVGAAATPATARDLMAKLAPYPETKLETREEFIDGQEASITTLLSLLYALLALSVVISLFGMVNMLALSVLERTRELGMLRAVGMTRRDVRRLVRHESVITALIGLALGVPIGIFLAALVTRALSSEGIVFAIPGRSLVLFAVVAVLAGVGAAVLPARRAARLNILNALHHE